MPVKQKQADKRKSFPTPSDAFGLLSNDIPEAEIDTVDVLRKANPQLDSKQISLIDLKMGSYDPRKTTVNTNDLRRIRSKDDFKNIGELSQFIPDTLAEERPMLGSNMSLTNILLGGDRDSEDSNPTSLENLTNSTAAKGTTSQSSSRTGSQVSLLPTNKVRRRTFAMINEQQKGTQGLSVINRISIDELKTVRQQITMPAEVLSLEKAPEHDSSRNEFMELCDEIISAYGLFQNTLIEIMKWKDQFFKVQVPPTTKVNFALICSRLFRSKSEIQLPLFELIKQVMMFSQSWHEKRFAITRLESDYHKLLTSLDIAIRKLELMKTEKDKLKSSRAEIRWGELTRKLLVRHHQNKMAKWMLLIYTESKEYDRLRNPEEKDKTFNLGGDSETSMHDIDIERINKLVDSNASSLNSLVAEPAKPKARISLTQYKLDKAKLDSLEKIANEKKLNISSLVKPKRKTLYVSETSTRFHIPDTNALFSSADVKAMKKSYSMILSSKLLHNDATQLPHRSMVSSNSYNACLTLNNADWIKPFDKYDIDDEQEIFLINTDTYPEMPEEKEERRDMRNISDMPDGMLFEEIVKSANDSLLETLDAEKTWFSLQDVIELTLLHSQQMQLLQDKHRDAVEKMNQAIEELEDRNEQLEFENNGLYEELNKRDEQLSELQQQIDTVKVKENVVMIGGVHNGSRRLELYNKMIQTDDIGLKFSKSFKKSPKHKDRLVNRSASPQKMTQNNFERSFLSRLEKFTKEKLEKRKLLIQKTQKLEPFLSYFKEQNADPRNEILKAEFMPLPPQSPTKEKPLSKSRQINV
ncbi:hypothetical protein ROZALSC1DRAFT_28374 [Rozella allomycis CSF55]|uniref:Uncharacterized protein n=1 Tax=Rozella allomycis (strain CSF55) TaxID=988480 RepID=A0A075APM0_ROZAC|nr:hypothetical protein O9G_003921 [Rozella allomycis CSF55]RKP20104.1 hypothetical protein ROZALSC1DRAFT_28374 [Rozella allomycis CSF55]|eukprot:EPZ32074.1 hypothetical protein O9G_003921 [Rozella allomycis CSF55]